MAYTRPIETRGLSVTKTVSGTVPVDILQVREHLNIDSDEHNGALELLTVAGVRAVEAYCNISLQSTTIIARYEAAGRVELPYGPVVALTSVKDKDGVTLDATEYTVEGQTEGFIALDLQREEPTVITYSAGYTTVPEDLKLAVVKWVTDHFEARTGFDMSGKSTVQILPVHWKTLANPYRRITWWA